MLRDAVTATAVVKLADQSAAAGGIETAQAGIERAYDSTFPRVYAYVRYRVGNPDTADDLTSRTFLRALDRLESFDPRRGEIGQWILGIARNVVRSHLRTRRRWGWLPFDWLQEPAAPEPDPEQGAIRSERHRRLLEAIRGLSARERDVLGLKFGAGLTNRAIAGVTGLKESHVATILEQHSQQLAKGESWYQATPYGGFGGAVPIGERATVRRVSHLADLRGATPDLEMPTGVHRGEPVRFDHALLAPGGIALIFFGSGANEVFLSAFPVGDGRSVGYSRGVSRRASDEKRVLESPGLKLEEISVGGQAVVWDPDPAPPPPAVHWPATWFPRREATSALRWEEEGVSYSLMGRSLTREEAVDMFISRRPVEDVE